ncbi:MAG: oligosaccharide flippase family protein [Rhodospirillales bacterium]|nr:oligosaccharide flippase family protein [Rhodospirillales bacterium]
MPDQPPAAPGAARAPTSLARRVAVGAVWMVAIRFASRTLGLVSMLVVARILVPADYGLVAVATAFSQSVDAVSEVGLIQALVRHPDDARELYDTAFTLQAIRGCLTAAVVALAAPFAGPWLGDPRLTPILLVLAALAALGGFENVAIAEFRRNLRFGVELVLQILPRVLMVATAITAALIWRSYWALILAMAVSTLARLAATYAVHPHRPRPALGRWRDLAHFSFWTWATSLAGIAWSRSDAFIISPALGAAAFGLYALAWEVGSLPVSELIAPVAGALFPGFAEARRRGEAGALAPLAVVAFLTMLVAPIAIAISAAAGPVVAVLLGPRWLAARPLVAVIASICAVAPFGWVAATLLSASGRVARYFVVVALSAAVRVAMLLHAVQGGDLLAVAWWSVASLVFEALVFAVVLYGASELRLRDGLGGLARTFLASAVTLGAIGASGWGWHAAPAGSAARAFVEGAAIGLSALAVFVATTALLWWGAGRPQGPETRLVAMLRPLFVRRRSAA